MCASRGCPIHSAVSGPVLAGCSFYKPKNWLSQNSSSHHWRLLLVCWFQALHYWDFNWHFKIENNNKLCRLSERETYLMKKSFIYIYIYIYVCVCVCVCVCIFFFNCQCLFWEIQGYLLPVFPPLQCLTRKSFKRFTGTHKYGLCTSFLPEIYSHIGKMPSSNNCDLHKFNGANVRRSSEALLDCICHLTQADLKFS